MNTYLIIYWKILTVKSETFKIEFIFQRDSFVHHHNGIISVIEGTSSSNPIYQMNETVVFILKQILWLSFRVIHLF